MDPDRRDATGDLSNTSSSAAPRDSGAEPTHHGAVVLVSGAAALGGFLFGYDTAIINGTVDAIEAEFHMSAGLLGFVVSSALLGCAVGAWFAGPLADRVGRVRVMLIAAALFAVSAIGSGLAVGPVSLAVWRIVGGLAIGTASVIAPAYIAEMSPAGLRGRLGSLQQLAIVLGIFISLLVDYALARVAGGAAEPVPWGGAAWRWMFVSAAIPAVVYGVLALQIPESPRFLVKQRHLDQARRVLARFVGGNVDARLREISRSLAGGEQKVHLSELRGPRFGLLPIVWVGILLSVFQQFVGINVIFYYSTTLWRAVGFSESDALLTSVITSITNIVTTLVAIALIDRIGRKPLLVIGASGMVVTLGVLAWCFSTATGSGASLTLDPTVGKIALVAANLYVVAFGMSWGPVVWVLLGEMFNNRIRATALAVAAAAQWVANWLVSTSFPVLADLGLTFAYGLYTLFAALALIFVLRAVRETKGRELEEM
ncbi:MFS transporter, sugar porter (SP) family [Micromonospora pattaloongensis]|uniref:MFS transporter, sugar porter (SP) family n=1 Tax=Micromonospora pattaloongensis TaxID=405436 RepID=A0A1H3H2G9_9ACTN|nr:sugar porter family MFS transporter [Micromonospora pattaloongensis]SDY08839.1 MFS transporter, sugar porter (SP) family [Micromonospora pattaloongensis]